MSLRRSAWASSSSIVRQAFAGIHGEKDEVGSFDRNIDFGPNLGGEAIFELGSDSPGIGQLEGDFPPGAIGGNPIAGDARLIVNNRDPPAREPIEDRGLSRHWAGRQWRLRGLAMMIRRS